MLDVQARSAVNVTLQVGQVAETVVVIHKDHNWKPRLRTWGKW